MKKESEYIRLARSLAHWFAGTSTPEENNSIEKWRSASEGNCKLYKKIQENIVQETEIKKYDSVNTTEAYHQFVIHKFSKQKNLKRIKLLKQTVRWAAIFLLFLGTASYFYFRQTNTTPIPVAQEQPRLPDAGDIQPGKSEAILILADGQQVTLDKAPAETLEQHYGIQISLEEGKLKYNKPQTMKAQEPEYNTIQIPRGGEYYLELSDGTRLWLNSDTRLRYPTAFSDKERRIYLEKGEIFLEVAKNREHPFYVECTNSSIRVLGTSFNILSYAGEPTQTTLVTGAVEVYSSGEKLKLSPGEQANVGKDGSITKRQVNIQLYTSWKDGRYYFKSERLETILEKISRWYNISVIYKQENLKEKAFSGSFLKYNNFQEVLDILNTTQTVKFKVLENRIIEVSE